VFRKGGPEGCPSSGPTRSSDGPQVCFDHEPLRVGDDPDQVLVTYLAEPGSAGEQALAFLASWAAGPVPLHEEQRSRES
jgi:hypothetical protein